nr:cytochrome c3 family protein [uncultured Carboxylicivirga sp.]
MGKIYKTSCFLFVLLTFSFYGNAQQNQQCLKCHGQVFYQYDNEWTGKVDKRPMNPFYYIDSVKMHVSVHKEFSCTDCHSPDYETFPHSGELRMEEKYACIDCHGGDEHFAKYNFEGIEQAFMESVHFKANDDKFNCWMCHDPHGYQLALRGQESIKDVVSLSNQMCLDCHTNKFKFGLISDEMPKDIAETHIWLPNQPNHFENVRCIDCHTQVQSDLLVSHKILPKEEALNNCVKCHSANSVLMESLYSHRVKESREESGFINAAILNEGYMIGANRNLALNYVSVILFGMLLIGLLIHFILRLTIKNKK